MEVLTVLYILMFFMILGSIVALEARDLLSTVIAVGAVGYGLSIIYLILNAPDIAITQMVVEVLILVILIRATVTRDDTTYGQPRDVFALASALVFAGLFLGFSYYVFRWMTPFGSPLMTVAKDYLAQGLELTGAANYVMAVLLDFRAYDTLGEATVIFTSIIGAYVILRKVGRKRRESASRHDTHS